MYSLKGVGCIRDGCGAFRGCCMMPICLREPTRRAVFPAVGSTSVAQTVRSARVLFLSFISTCSCEKAEAECFLALFY